MGEQVDSEIGSKINNSPYDMLMSSHQQFMHMSCGTFGTMCAHTSTRFIRNRFGINCGRQHRPYM